MSQPLYRIEEQSTSGWTTFDDDCKNLTKEQCKEKYDNIIFLSGIAPDRLRIVREK